MKQLSSFYPEADMLDGGKQAKKEGRKNRLADILWEIFRTYLEVGVELVRKLWQRDLNYSW